MNHSEKQTTAQPKTVALFVSDVHLNPGMPHTTGAFLQFLNIYGTQTEQLFLLGDLFEYWVGDDDISDSYNFSIVSALRELTLAGTKVYWIAGNRDFLIGPVFAAATGAEILTDPSIVHIAGRKIVLCHGDEQCTDDTSYMQFRNQVRNQVWQSNFLALPLSQRKTIVQGMRQSSKKEQSQKDLAIMDVNQEAISKLFTSSSCDTMIHGHTHRPYLHTDDKKYRYVLPDWDCDTEQKRGGWISIDANGKIERINITNCCDNP